MAYLIETDLSEADLSKADLRAAVLRGATLLRTQLADARLTDPEDAGNDVMGLTLSQLRWAIDTDPTYLARLADAEPSVDSD
jgi:uncharacterized protein YjbI with pentapeptide repeats